MDSPILLLAFWFVVNLVIKSAKDKKNIEEARRKKNQQMDNRPIQSKNLSNTRKDESRSNPNKNKSIIDVFKEEIEREIQKEKEKQINNQTQNSKQMKPIIKDNKVYTSNSSSIESKKVETNTNYFEESKDKTPKVFNEVTQTQIHKPKLDLKNDVLKGIIFSEILSESKGSKNFKRGI